MSGYLAVLAEPTSGVLRWYNDLLEPFPGDRLAHQHVTPCGSQDASFDN